MPDNIPAFIGNTRGNPGVNNRVNICWLHNVGMIVTIPVKVKPMRAAKIIPGGHATLPICGTSRKAPVGSPSRLKNMASFPFQPLFRCVTAPID